MKPTTEQQEIIETSKTGSNMVIVAGAGTGKSSTLRLIAEANPTKNFLCLCFNKANQLESNSHPGKPSNIYYTTTHSLAYRDIVDSAYRSKLQFLSTSDVPMGIVEARRVSGEITTSEATIISKELRLKVVEVLNKFLQSDYVNISEFVESFYQDYMYKDFLLGTTILYWESILSTSKGSARMSHDCYLKMYQKQQRKLFTYAESSKSIPVEVHGIMLDEMQDTTPCVASIFLQNDHLQQIVVGDPHQQIYSFRGAVNIMGDLPGFAQKFLTQSFRFNSSIARKANEVLKNKSSDFLLEGVSNRTSIETKTYLCRTNAAVLETILYD